MKKKSLPKIIVILGPTTSGKSDLAVKLAEKFNGEIISADSRQIYKGMDIGTGKVPKDKSKIKNQKSKLQGKIQNLYYYKGIRHHLLDVVNPRQKFDVVRYKKLADKAIEDILRRKKLPIVCGGTGFYIQAIVDNVIFPEVKANEALRKKLEKYSLERLLKTLKKLDSKRFKTIDQKNKRRIIRAIEIAVTLGKVPKLKSIPKYNALQIGIDINKETLRKNIGKRLEKRLKQGMIAEVKKLHQQGLSAGRHGVSWKRLIEFGLEYRFIAFYLQDKITKPKNKTSSLQNRQEMIYQLETAINQYAKRQITWFKKDKRIKWLAEKNAPAQNEKMSEKLTDAFLNAKKRYFN